MLLAICAQDDLPGCRTSHKVNHPAIQRGPKTGMTKDKDTGDVEDLAKRRVPCMVAFLRPFRLVEGPNSTKWKLDISAINQRRWDYVELHRMVGGIDIGLPPPFHMAVFRDGALSVPVLPQFRTITASVEFINQSLSALLLGGVYCEAIGLDALDFGYIIDWTYLRVATSARANTFHQHIRLQRANAVEAIELLEPPSIAVAELSEAMTAGRRLMDVVPELSPEFLLKGVTALARHDSGTALSNLWIVIEQLSSNLWNQKVLMPARSEPSIPGRSDQLADFRTWTTATRHELLYQTGVVTYEALQNLAAARKARNALAHMGKHPTNKDAKAAFDASLSLLGVVAGKLPVPLATLDYDKFSLADPFAPPPRRPRALNPTHWMEIPKLPGEVELERLEAMQRVEASRQLRLKKRRSIRSSKSAKPN